MIVGHPFSSECFVQKLMTQGHYCSKWLGGLKCSDPGLSRGVVRKKNCQIISILFRISKPPLRADKGWGSRGRQWAIKFCSWYTEAGDNERSSIWGEGRGGRWIGEHQIQFGPAPRLTIAKVNRRCIGACFKRALAGYSSASRQSVSNDCLAILSCVVSVEDRGDDVRIPALESGDR